MYALYLPYELAITELVREFSFVSQVIAARHIGVDPAWVCRHVNAGILPRTETGRIAIEDVEGAAIPPISDDEVRLTIELETITGALRACRTAAKVRE